MEQLNQPSDIDFRGRHDDEAIASHTQTVGKVSSEVYPAIDHIMRRDDDSWTRRMTEVRTAAQAVREDLRKTDDRAQKPADDLRVTHANDVARLMDLIEMLFIKDTNVGAAPAEAPRMTSAQMVRRKLLREEYEVAKVFRQMLPAQWIGKISIWMFNVTERIASNPSKNSRFTEISGNGNVNNGKFLSSLRLTDDIVIFAKNTTEAEAMLRELDEAGRKIGLRTNRKKTQFSKNS
ncbi:unnamed protein product [Nippostrongylus brasiliensis]|uniref:Reverse transcriptase domain-containing protein n=1 Tax=Nippostrongylus brasiliensis TaxID=27835 RepID=A0A158R005_NIPBR|nr:unnamed protein product [Nippostrongylus brasiliensis]